MSSEDLSTTSKEITTYHRLIEAMKFAFAEKMKEGDPDFIEADKFDVSKVIASSNTSKFLRLYFLAFSEGRQVIKVAKLASSSQVASKI